MNNEQDNIKKATILAVGVYSYGFSFTRVFESLLKELSAYYTIHWLGIGYKGKLVSGKYYTLHAHDVHGGDLFGTYGAIKLAQELNINTMLLLNDFYLLRNYKYVAQPMKEKGIRLVAYVPLDGRITDINITQESFFLDELVLYHNKAMQEVKKAMNLFLAENSLQDFSKPHLSYRYHGVDSSTFRPLASKAKQIELKKRLFDVPDAADAIFILNANRFSERKDIATTIQAFKKAIPLFKKPSYLCLHTPNIDSEKRPLLQSLIANSGCDEYILLNPLGEDYLSDEKLAKLYQCCDIGVNSSLGEGWGMISFEHAACGAAQLVPAHTACAEVWKDAGILIPSSRSVQLSTSPFLMNTVNVNELSNQLVKLVNDSSYLENNSKNCFHHTQKDEFKWKRIASLWKELL